MGDADDSYDFSALDNFLKQLRAGDDLVVGNRFKGGVAPGAMPFLHRYLGNPVLSLVGRLFFRVPLGDFHCGLRGFRTQTMRDLGLRTTGMEFASEMIVRSGLVGLKISESPTTLKPDGRSRRPHLKTWRDGWRHLKFLLIYSPKWLFVVPGTIFLAAGIVLASILSAGTLWIPGGAALDLNSFTVACFFTILGTQAIGFGMIARRYAAMVGNGRVLLLRHAGAVRCSMCGQFSVRERQCRQVLIRDSTASVRFLMEHRMQAKVSTGTNAWGHWQELWHVWFVVMPRRSITGKLVRGKVWRRREGQR